MGFRVGCLSKPACSPTAQEALQVVSCVSALPILPCSVNLARLFFLNLACLSVEHHAVPGARKKLLELSSCMLLLQEAQFTWEELF